MTLRLYKLGWFHRKNEEGLNLVAKLPGVSVKIWNGETDGILLCGDYRPSLLTDGKLPKDSNGSPKVLFGPHVCFRDGVKWFNEYNVDTVIYMNVLSKWVEDLYHHYVIPNPKIQFCPIPFPVDVEQYKPQPKMEQYFIYIKHISNDKVMQIQRLLTEMCLPHFSLQYIFVYGEYNEADYRTAISTCKFGIWIDAHESQGFALQEALSSGCPLFVYNAQDMKEEIQYGKQVWGDWNGPLKCTSASYFDDTCGSIYNENTLLTTEERFIECKQAFKLFMDHLPLYRPRQFVLDHLTAEKFVQSIRTLFP